MNRKEIELLAPAGNKESFIAACQNGASAVYMGVSKYNARTMAQNFTEEEYKECIQYAHERNVMVYLTLNTLLYDFEIEDAVFLVSRLYQYGLDAVIVQDIGLAKVLHQTLPKLPLHASTQMSIYDIEQVKLLETLGFSRVVLARELTIPEIQDICKKTTLEVEVFVHGALCVSVSGQCLLSSMNGGRSANRGKCAQPCRMPYTLYEKDKKMAIKTNYILSKKDIFGLEHVHALIQAGVTSLKIEGRNKSAEYVAGIVSCYRKEIAKQGSISLQEQEDILQLFNRDGKSSGYLDGVPKGESITVRSPKNTGLYLGKVIEQRKQYIKVKLEREIALHDGIEIYQKEEIYSHMVTCIRDDFYQLVNTKKQKGEYVWLGDVKENIQKGCDIYKTSSASLIKEYHDSYQKERIHRELPLWITLEEGKFPSAKTILDEKVFFVVGEEKIQLAQTKALTPERVEEIFQKTGKTPFVWKVEEISMADNLFASVSVLNELRRELLEAVQNNFYTKREQNVSKEDIQAVLLNCTEKKAANKNALMVYRYDPDKAYPVWYQNTYHTRLERIDIPVLEYIKHRDHIIKNYQGEVELYLVFPNVMLQNGKALVETHLQAIVKEREIAGVVLESFTFLEMIKKIEEKIDVVAGVGLNITNSYSAAAIKELGFQAIRCSPEVFAQDKQAIADILPIEVVENYVTVLTSRYCILGSFLGGDKKSCSQPCRKHSYQLKDDYKNTYAIVCDKSDCIMRLVKEIPFVKFGKDEGRQATVHVILE